MHQPEPVATDDPEPDQPVSPVGPSGPEAVACAGGCAEELERAAVAIEGALGVALACHVTPDGDALGSTLALHLALRAAGRVSVASFPEPFVVGPHYRYLPGLDTLTSPDHFPVEPEVMVTFDCGSMGRLGELSRPAQAAHELVVVDHHVSNDRYGTINVVDGNVAASAVIAYRLIVRLGLPLDRDTAICLYTGIVCDTGRFQYESTTPEVFEIAGRLASYDLPIPSMSRSLFEEHRFSYLRLLGEVLGQAVLEPEHGFVWAVIDQDHLARHGVSYEETEGLIDIVRRTAEADVACVCKQAHDGTWRISLRSVGATDVSQIASANGGGGHKYAAGFSAAGPPDEIVGKIRALLP
jgi:bifunctional oligoribonuclease and PAP phosphatase NrnA